MVGYEAAGLMWLCESFADCAHHMYSYVPNLRPQPQAHLLVHALTSARRRDAAMHLGACHGNRVCMLLLPHCLCDTSHAAALSVVVARCCNALQALQLMAARQAVLARRAAAAAGAASPAQAAASAMQRVDPRAAAAAAARSTGDTAAGPAPGSQAWVDEWAPAPATGRGRQQQQRGGGRGGRRSRGRGRGGGRHDGAAGVLSEEAAAAAEAEDIAAALAASLALVQRPIDDGLDPCRLALWHAAGVQYQQHHYPRVKQNA